MSCGSSRLQLGEGQRHVPHAGRRCSRPRMHEEKRLREGHELLHREADGRDLGALHPDRVPPSLWNHRARGRVREQHRVPLVPRNGRQRRVDETGLCASIRYGRASTVEPPMRSARSLVQWLLTEKTRSDQRERENPGAPSREICAPTDNGCPVTRPRPIKGEKPAASPPIGENDVGSRSRARRTWT